MKLQETIETLKAAAEPLRYRLLALCAHGPMSVSELVSTLGQSQPGVSRHLKLLADAGLLERHRDGKHIYYRVAKSGNAFRHVRLMLSLVDSDDAQLANDLKTALNKTTQPDEHQLDPNRLFNRAILDIAATGYVGSVLDIGMGSARIMTLLASSATRLIGVDKERAVRIAARATLAKAGLTNCSVLQGDMYQLPFDHEEFNTVIMDEILYHSDEPVFALTEAARTMVYGGRMIILESFTQASDQELIEKQLTQWFQQTQIRGGSLRHVHGGKRHWLIAVGTKLS